MNRAISRNISGIIGHHKRSNEARAPGLLGRDSPGQRRAHQTAKPFKNNFYKTLRFHLQYLFYKLGSDSENKPKLKLCAE